MRHEQHLLSEVESARVIDEINAWCRRTGTNYNKLITAARVNTSLRYCVLFRGCKMREDTAARLRGAMSANPRGIEKGEHRSRVRANAVRLATRQQDERSRLTRPVDRSPCPYCETRRDLGCRHFPKPDV